MGTRDQVRAWLRVVDFAAGTVVAIVAAHVWLQHSPLPGQREPGRLTSRYPTSGWFGVLRWGAV
jgi:hypothetical protein